MFTILLKVPYKVLSFYVFIVTVTRLVSPTVLSQLNDLLTTVFLLFRPSIYPLSF